MYLPNTKRVVEDDHDRSGEVEMIPELSTIFIRGMVDEKMSTKFHQCMLLLNNMDGGQNKLIYVHITSPGGLISHCFYMVDLMQASKRPVATIVGAYAFSAASILAAAGHKGLRYAYPHSTLMLHEASTELTGTYSDIKTKQGDFKALMQKMVELISSLTGKEKSQIESDIKKDMYLNPKAAIKYGLIDRVWGA